VKAEVFRKLQEADWRAIGTQVTAHATWKAQNFAWRTGDHEDLALGLQAIDIAQTAIKKVLTGERAWNPERGDLLSYLKGVVDSLVSHMANSMDNSLQARLAEDEEGKELLDDTEFHAARNDDFGLLSSHQRRQGSNTDWQSQLVAELFTAVEGHDDLMAVLDVVMSSGETKPAEIATELSVEVSEVHNRVKRLRRAASHIKGRPSAEDKMKTRRTEPV
jgi:DNA-directed RNA polymerase specialized sigma24 family protein